MNNQQSNAPNRTSAGMKAAASSPIDWTSFFLPLCCIPWTVIAWRTDSHIVWNIVGLTAAVTGMLPLLMDTRTWLTVGRQRRPVKLAAIGMCALLALFCVATVGLLVTM